MDTNDQRPTTREIVPPRLAVKAMRDSGYRNTAYALAELIDNSVQAQASEVVVICNEGRRLVSQRERRYIDAIAVLDDGKGMTPDQLSIALQFGNGTHLEDRSGIGRFGMGLPNSSISQCRRLDVWSWQAGPDNALHTYLDLDQIDQGTMVDVPLPRAERVPDEWRRRAPNALRTTGTLVVWSQFDEHRLTWRTGKATLENTEVLVGRMYRKFIARGDLAIRLLALEDESPTYSQLARINDPLYLTTESSTPAPFDKTPMFQPWGDGEDIFHVPYNGKEYDVAVRMSWAKPETIPQDGTDRGAKSYGKHARRNIGVSIVRAGRELDLDSGWTIGYDPLERWWGIEVEFPPELDEVFGVPNNKQAATVFSQMAHFEWDSEAEPNERRIEVMARLRAEGDPRADLMDIEQHIRDQLASIRARIRDQSKGRRSGGKRHEDVSVDDRATEKFKQRAESGHETPQDKVPFDDKAKSDLVNNLIAKHYPPDTAKSIADAVELRGKRVIFVDAEIDGFAFFKVELRGAVTEVVFNTRHPAYAQLVRALDDDVTGASDRDLIERISNASDTVKMLFAAWARYVMEDVANRAKIDDVRQDWGRMARLFLQDE